MASRQNNKRKIYVLSLTIFYKNESYARLIKIMLPYYSELGMTPPPKPNETDMCYLYANVLFCDNACTVGSTLTAEDIVKQ